SGVPGSGFRSSGVLGFWGSGIPGFRGCLGLALALALASGLAAPTIPTAQPKEPHQKTKSSDPQIGG
ncbi:hypothetical protein MHH60_32605, partial [Paenibacillus sp. FSL H7-0716]|uniref:hypothetical protein n=1 Tax=Paenibacillus sp. FSL H7-0716 TaxID=2921439 RepID=UPI0030FD02D8